MSEDKNKEFEEIIEKLKSEHNIEEMVKFDENTIKERLADNAFNIVKYKELYYKEKYILDKLIEMKERNTGRIIDGIRFPKSPIEKETDKWIREHSDKVLKPTEIKEFYVPQHPLIIEINKKIQRQQLRVDFFDLCAKAFEQQGWRMKSFLDEMKCSL